MKGQLFRPQNKLGLCKIISVHKGFYSLLVCGLFLTGSKSGRAEPSSTPEETRALQKQLKNQTLFSADTMTWDDSQSKLIASGKVRLRQGELELQCDLVSVFFLPSLQKASPAHFASSPWAGLELERVEARGQVSLTYGKLQLSAAEVHYHHPKRELLAKGSIRGQWEDMRLTGTQLKIELQPRQVSVQRAVLNFTLPKVLNSSSVEDWFKR